MEWAPLSGFKSRKAAQAAAYFASREGAAIEKMKLIKLLYLAEREFVGRHEFPMFYDESYSLKDGPILSSALNGINGKLDPKVWGDYLTKHDNKNVSANSRYERDDLDEISIAEFAVLEATYASFGHMSAAQIRNYTHKNCSEYTEVVTGRMPILLFDILRALNVDAASEKADNIAAMVRAESLISGR